MSTIYEDLNKMVCTFMETAKEIPLVVKVDVTTWPKEAIELFEPFRAGPLTGTKIEVVNNSTVLV